MRKQYSAIDVLEQAKGLPTPEGWGVLTKEFIADLCKELDRLYQLEDELPRAIRQLQTAVSELSKPKTAVNEPVVISAGEAAVSGYATEANRTLRNLADLCNLDISAPV